MDGWNFYQISQPQRIYITEGPGCRATARVCVPSWRSKYGLKKEKKKSKRKLISSLPR